MATRDIYETGFDEDVQTNSSTNPCPECDGRVTTNAIETICEDCGLVIDEQRIDHGPEWRTHDQDQRKRTGAPLTAARHDRGLSTEIGRGKDANGNNLSGQKHQRLSRMRREQSRGRFQSKAERNLAHGLGEVRRISGALELSIRCAIRRVSCSGAHRMKICCVADPSRRSPQRACTARVDVTASRDWWARSARWPASWSHGSRMRTKR